MDVQKQTQLQNTIRAVEYFLVPGCCIEIRALNLPGRYRKADWGGYFDNAEAAAKAILQCSDNNAEGVYITLNPLKKDVLARRANRVEYADKKYPFATDGDVARLRWMYVDIDPVRPAGVSSTVEEKQHAVDAAKKINAFLLERGFGSILAADSGNGVHLLVKIDLPVSEAGTVKKCLQALAAKFNSKTVKIDTVNFNPGRITKAYGSVSRKGDHTPERPYRRSQLLDGGVAAEGWDNPVGRDLLEALAAEAPPEPARKGKAQVYIVPPEGTTFVKRDATDEQVRAYLSKMPPAVSGQGGHSTTFATACVLVLGFDLSIEKAMPFFEEWNQTCQPPWSERELERKLLEADEKTGERGYLIAAGLESAAIEPAPEFDIEPPAGSFTINPYTETVTRATIPQMDPAPAPSPVSPSPVPAAPQSPADSSVPADSQASSPDGSSAALPVPRPEDDPTRIARVFADRFTTVVDGKKFSRVIRWNNDWYLYSGSDFRFVSPEQMELVIWGMVEDEFERIYRQKVSSASTNGSPPIVKKVNQALVSAVMKSLMRQVIIESEVMPPVWLTPLGESQPHKSAASMISTVSGIVDMKNPMKILPPTPQLFTLSSVPCQYDPLAKCPTWDNFMISVFGEDTQSIETLEEWLGYLLTHDTSQHKLLLMIGPKRSGKGTIMRVIAELVGSRNVTNPTLSDLGRQFGSHALFGRMVATIGDARLSGKADISSIVERILSITGEDLQNVDRKNHDVMTGIRLPTRFVITSNELPRLTDAAGAITSRAIVVTFTRTFEHKEDKQLERKLKQEISGILNRAIEGWHRLSERGYFLQPESGREELEEFEELTSPIKSFVRDCCKFGPDLMSELDALYHHYKAWCDATGISHPLHKNVFARDLKSAYRDKIESKRMRKQPSSSQERHYKGIGLKPGSELSDEMRQKIFDEFDFE